MEGSVDVILDCFLFCHELDMLELRLRLLYNYVDKFVLFENNRTHSGNDKPYYFDENKERFGWALDKIHHIKGENIPPGKEGRDLAYEFSQRQVLCDEILTLTNPEDIIMISDIDEIPTREVIEEIKLGKHPYPSVLVQDLYYYNIHCPRGRKWDGTLVFKADKPIDDIQTTRGRRSQMNHIPDAGWHFSYFMNVKDIQQKLGSFAHGLYNAPPYNTEENIKESIVQNKNFLGKTDGDKKPNPIPEYLMSELSKFHLFVGVQ